MLHRRRLPCMPVARPLLKLTSMLPRALVFLPAPRRRPAVRAAALSSVLLALAACGPDSPQDPPDAGVQPDAQVPLPPPPPPPPPPLYQTSLAPVYQLTPASELVAFEIHGRALTAGDFQAAGVTVSVEDKLDEIGARVGAERGVAPLELFPDAEQRARAADIPFRGNPSDIALLSTDGTRKAYVPLGGDVMAPGNEVAAIDLVAGTSKRIEVGIRPQQVAVHPESGLVFVCNEYSPYVSIIDSRTDALFQRAGSELQILTVPSCSDLLLVERDPDAGEPDALFLYVANEQRASVLAYSIDILRDIQDNPTDIIVHAPTDAYWGAPLAEITGVGPNPARLSLDESRSRIFVANQRGGEVAIVSVAENRVIARAELGAPSLDVVQVGARLYVPTTTPHRGLLQQGAPVSDAVLAAPIAREGVDGQSREIHPGARFDGTASYDVEDLRSGVFALDVDDLGVESYVTDDNDADAAFTSAQKQLAGALPWSIARNAQGTRIYVPLLGSDMVQELDVTDGAVSLRASGRRFATRELPSAVAVDQAANQLLVTSLGGEVLEIFALDSGVRLSEIDLGYAEPRYPATTIEAGEYLFATARWSNDGRKSCAGCHTQRLSSDGLGFAVGTAAPTVLRRVAPMHDLIATAPYLSNGGAPAGSQAVTAIAAQARTSCELVLHGLVEGPHAAPATRVGDPANFTRDAGDAGCRPDVASLDPATGLPGNFTAGSTFDDIAAIIASQEQTAAAAMTGAVRVQLTRAGLFHDDPAADRQDLERAIGFYLVAELRLPPNALAQQRALGALDVATAQKLQHGEEIFRNVAGCASCHDPDATRHPFTDNRNYGRGADWLQAFVNTYDQDARLLALLPGGLPAPVVRAADVASAGAEPTVFQPVIDAMVPTCFSPALCLRFDDPLAVRGSDPAEEARRLRRLVMLQLAGAGFLAGAVVDQPAVNNPSLRGVWLQRSLLHHGLARSIEEAILPPGHAALRPDQHGRAVDDQGNFDVHGSVRALAADDIEALVLYVQSIE
jgi:DNA-binding beta-propeller fold protein YncE/cytochrome c peroxidase